MVDRAAELLAAVLAAPDDDMPRLVYADWLSERGDPRGEFIAIQIARARLPAGDPDQPALAAREAALWETHRDHWRQPYGRAAVEHRRGFVERLRCAEWQLRQLDLEATCVRALAVDGDDAGDVAMVVRTRARELRLRELAIDAQVRLESVEALLHDPAIAAVADLGWNVRGGATGVVDAIGKSALALTTLRLRVWLATLREIRTWTRPLRRLDLRYGEVGDGGLVELVATPALAQLESLDLTRTGVGRRDVDAICAAAMPLRVLDLSDNARLDTEVAHRIADTPRFARLERLDLTYTQIGAAGLAALVASPHLPRTLELVLDGDLLGLTPDYVFNDQGRAIDGGWTGRAAPHLEERFRIVGGGTSLR